MARVLALVMTLSTQWKVSRMVNKRVLVASLIVGYLAV